MVMTYHCRGAAFVEHAVRTIIRRTLRTQTRTSRIALLRLHWGNQQDRMKRAYARVYICASETYIAKPPMSA